MYNAMNCLIINLKIKRLISNIFIKYNQSYLVKSPGIRTACMFLNAWFILPG